MNDQNQFQKGFPINIGGNVKAVWDGTRIDCNKCGKIVGIAFELNTNLAILFSLDSPMAEPHKCDDKKELRHG